MTVLQGVLAGAGLAAAILSGVWRMLEALRRENRDAHTGISQRIDRVDDRAERRAETHRTALEAHRTALEAITREVAFLSGRQAERDQKPKQPHRQTRTNRAAQRGRAGRGTTID